MERKTPVIIGDIGGTNSRLSIIRMTKVIDGLNIYKEFFR
jgi:glucokinase